MRSARSTLLLSIAILGLQFGCAELEGVDFSQILDTSMPLDQATVASGLKEALEVGTRRTTATLSGPEGFSRNPAIRLALPEELSTLASVLRGVGLGAQVDALEDSMNQAAEEAATAAVPVFTRAISSMSISDAFEILNGPDDAATTYFYDRTSDDLRAQFSPIAAKAMNDVGLYEIYGQLVARYDQIPFAKPPAVDLEDYVADQTLAALFAELADEEARIREDPGARSTALLRRVFGASGTSTPGSP